MCSFYGIAVLYVLPPLDTVQVTRHASCIAPPRYCIEGQQPILPRSWTSEGLRHL